MQIEIATRHGVLGPVEQAYVQEKAEKLVKYFGRLMAVEVAVDHVKHAWNVEIRVSAEHKHDFVAACRSMELMASIDDLIEKMEQQLRKYKQKVQDRHRGPGHRQAETPEVPGPANLSAEDGPDDL